jgi:hypothetical protein
VSACSVAVTPPEVPVTSSAVTVAGATVVDELDAEEVGVAAVADCVEAVDAVCVV